MNGIDKCKMSSCLRAHPCAIFGVILLVIASALTLITCSGLGIFGMFLTGVALCFHKHCCCKSASTCDDDSACVSSCSPTDTAEPASSPKKASTKKSV
jgi:hypothetical protein